MKTLYKNSSIINFADGKLNVIKNGYLATDGEYITYVGKEVPKEDFDCVRDMSGTIIMPGIYNCHTHTPMTLLRGVGSDLPLDKWLFEKVFPIEDKLTAEDIEAGSYLALMEMVSSGTVSFSDMYFEPQVTCEAVGKSGIKANISRPVQCFDPTENPADSYRIKQSLQLFDNFNKSFGGRVLVDFCIHAEYTCDEKTTRYYSALCNERHGNMHIHLSETAKEHKECIEKYGKTPAEWFSSLGAFDSRAFAAHCVELTENDMDILKEKGVSIVHNPTSNMKLGSGFAPVEAFLSKGINVTIGTDGTASNNNLDMLEEMHMASVIHNGFMRDATVMNAEKIIKMATVNGAILQGRENCGNLLPGFKADFVAISLDSPNMFPCLDESALVVYSAGRSDVVMTVVDGKTVYEKGEFLTIDKERVYYNVRKTVERLYN
ncbi:MAG: amidohydrolase [Clostridia bacterium]|nr:amidohydrolase [Clostridia bacterium]